MAGLPIASTSCTHGPVVPALAGCSPAGSVKVFQKKATGRVMKNQSHGWDSYGCRVLRPTPNWTISRWYWNSESSGEMTGMLVPCCCA